MNKFIELFVICLLFASLLFLLGCTADTKIPFLPFTASQFFSKVTDLNYTLFLQGYYDGNFVVVDGNKLSVIGDINGLTLNTDWSNIVGFPVGCGVGQAVQIIGASLTCVDLNSVASVDTNCAVYGSCSNVVYYPDINTNYTKKNDLNAIINQLEIDTNMQTYQFFNKDTNTWLQDFNLNKANGQYILNDANGYLKLWRQSVNGTGALSNRISVTTTTGGATTGWALNCDGAGDWAGTTSNPANLAFADTNPFTFSFWTKWKGAGSDGGGGTWLGKYGSNGYLLYNNISGTSLYEQYDGTGNSAGTRIPNDDAWYHVAWRNNGDGTGDWFVNNSKTSVGSVGTLTANTNNFWVCTYNGSAQTYKGYIDNLATWDRALTDAEVSDLYNSGTGLQVTTGGTFPSTSTSMNTNLQGLWEFDQNGDDYSANNYDLTVTNATYTTGKFTVSGPPTTTTINTDYNILVNDVNTSGHSFLKIGNNDINTTRIMSQKTWIDNNVDLNGCFKTMLDGNIYCKKSDFSSGGTGNITGTGSNTQVAYWTGTSTQSGNAGFVYTTSPNRVTITSSGNSGIPFILSNTTDGKQMNFAFIGNAGATQKYYWLMGTDVSNSALNNAYWYDNINGKMAFIAYGHPTGVTYGLVNSTTYMQTSKARLVVQDKADGNHILDVLNSSGTLLDYIDKTDGNAYFTKFFGQDGNVKTDFNVGRNARVSNDLNVTKNTYLDGNLFYKNPYGMFSSLKTQTIGSTTTGYVMDFNTTEDNYYIYRVGDTNFKVARAGDYLIELSIIASSNLPGKHINVWANKNGVNIPRSNTRLEFSNANSETLIAVMFIIDLLPTDNFSIMYAGDDTGITLPYTASFSSPPIPETPSSIITISRVGDTD